jgi:hypothetical protein
MMSQRFGVESLTFEFAVLARNNLLHNGLAIRTNVPPTADLKEEI